MGLPGLSVLTDNPSFHGAHGIPHRGGVPPRCLALRKVFLFERTMVYEARAGFDAISYHGEASRTDESARRWRTALRNSAWTCLVEIHDEAELERALKLTSSTDLASTPRLAHFLRSAGNQTERSRRKYPRDRSSFGG